MATYQITPPDKFEFGKPDGCPKWLKRFERFRIASGLDKKDAPSQINALIYTMGERAEDVLSQSHLSKPNQRITRLVVGLQDAKLYERLQLKADLTLEKAIDEARLNEAVKKQQNVVRGSPSISNENSVDKIGKKIWKHRDNKKPFKTPESKESKTKCGRCGKTPAHARAQCPAADA
ncbi:predicted protein [Nematostella vectensis]|uniref:Uncharacterized protein n=1 Tax=Nematostella vectensis TaxID=45351 RepID=A7SZF0_NEMVE|nr:predicted protein [Nematostella vectensis]|eukprot:XP_001623014.1 predicted protein [Nematostella vectensis]